MLPITPDQPLSPLLVCYVEFGRCNPRGFENAIIALQYLDIAKRFGCRLNGIQCDQAKGGELASTDRHKPFIMPYSVVSSFL